MISYAEPCCLALNVTSSLCVVYCVAVCKVNKYTIIMTVAFSADVDTLSTDLPGNAAAACVQ